MATPYSGGRVYERWLVIRRMASYRPVPVRAKRVWFQRTHTGNATIYLFEEKPHTAVIGGYVEHAFGWIHQDHAQNIWLPHQSGWCDFRPGQNENFVQFPTDDFRQQLRHWKSPPFSASDTEAPSQQLSKEAEMPTFDPYAAAAEQQARLNHPKDKMNIRTKCAGVADQLVANNKTAVVSAAYLEAGRIANNQATKQLSKHLPVMLRGYADTPVGRLALANVAQVAVQHYKADHATLNKLTSAMTQSAYAELIQSADIEGFIDGFLADPKIMSAMKKIED